MTDQPTHHEYPDDDRFDDAVGAATADRLDAWLRDPQVWSDAPSELERHVVAAISIQADAPSGSVAAVNGPTGSTTDRDERRRSGLALTAAAVAIVVSLGGLVLLDRGGTDSGVAVALSGTELARTASASATIDSTPRGTRITLAVVGLSPAEPGTYYQAWVRKGDTVVSAGSFHLRRGSGDIELWCGLEDPMDGTLVVTVEGYGARATPGPSERVVLVGDIRRPDQSSVDTE